MFLSPYSFTKVFGDWARKDWTRFLFCPPFKGAPAPSHEIAASGSTVGGGQAARPVFPEKGLNLEEDLPSVHPEQHQPIAEQDGGAVQERPEAGAEEGKKGFA